MEHGFWLRRWENNQIGFHEGRANALLVAHFHRLALPPGSRVFVPLCGKSRDIGWLLAQGHRVVAAELSEQAVTQLFDDLTVKPAIEQRGVLKLFSAPGLEVFVGDIMDVTRDDIGAVDAVHDRAALVALPADIRTLYATHLVTITDTARQFLICFEYDQTVMEGPPFSVDAQKVARLYGGSHHIELIDRIAVPGGLKGQWPAREAAWHLTPRRHSG